MYQKAFKFPVTAGYKIDKNCKIDNATINNYMKTNTRFLAVLLIGYLVLITSNLSLANETIPKSNFTILLSNDDGYNAPGLEALADALIPIAMVTVSAPSTQQSGAGHGITYREPVLVSSISNAHKIPWYSVSGRPATCVRLGLEHLIKEKPDLVISGINRGENLGLVTFHSGTVGAAREASFLGIPAIAVSLQGDDKNDYKIASEYIRKLVEKLKSQNLLTDMLLLNVNFPNGVSNGIQGTRITKLSSIYNGNEYYKLNVPLIKVYKAKQKQIIDSDPETDINAFSKGFVTITPLTIYQTDLTKLKDLKILED